LVAERNIIVNKNHVDTDRTIMATVMTLNPNSGTTKNFYVKNYDADRYGTLILYGGLIQYARGAVGTFGGYSRTGYLKDYTWDPRLRTMHPPYFPALFILKKISWWE